MDYAALCAVVADIAFKPLKIAVHKDGIDRTGAPRCYLQVSDPNGVCNVTGEPSPWKGRKWLLSSHATKTEVVYTALKAVLAAVEHEAREQFRYRGVTICDPHIHVDDLVVLRGRQPLDGRDHKGA